MKVQTDERANQSLNVIAFGKAVSSCACQFEVIFIHLQCLPMCADEKNVKVHPKDDVLCIYPKPGIAIPYIIVEEHWSWLSRDKNQWK